MDSWKFHNTNMMHDIAYLTKSYHDIITPIIIPSDMYNIKHGLALCLNFYIVILEF